ncbi:MAG: SDR family NAD(P)-dependent oxidoreductase [Acidimicrobiales bacterium]
MENRGELPQSVIVLGGSSDIARAITKKLCLAHTHTVILAGRNQKLLDQAALEAQEYGATKTDTVLFDAEELDHVAHTIEEAFAKVGDRVDLVVVAVGTVGNQSRDEGDAQGSTRMITVNVTWPVAALAEVRRRLIEQGSGHILVMSTAAAVRVRRVSYLYSGAKAGLDRICLALAESLEGTGVRLQVLRPAAVRTRMSLNLAPTPFTTGVNEVADNAVRGLTTSDVVIWSPPVLRYVFVLVRLMPPSLWRRLANR